MNSRIQLTPAQTKLARAGRRAMLATERATLAHLTAASQLALSRLLAVPPTRSSILVASAGIAEELRHSVAGAVQNGRAHARRAALGRLAVELGEAGRQLRLPPLQTPPARHDEASAAHSLSAADSYVAAWRASVILATRERERADLGKALRKASSSQDHRLDRIAATENSRAYNEAHDEGVGWVAEHYKEAKWLPLLVKRWDASLDRKTCEFCRSMDGAWAVIGTQFRGDVLPGEKHPRCRCLQSLVVPTPVTGFAVGYELAAA